MAVLQRTKISENQRLDLDDYNNIENFVCADFHQLSKKFFSENSLIVKGFKIFQDSSLSNAYPTQSPVYVEIAGSTLFHTNKISGPSFYVGAPGTVPTAITLTSNAINYIEVDLSVSTAVPDNKAFWDPTANNGLGEEFVQTVDTVSELNADVTVNTTGFSGGNKIPIAEIEVNSIGTIVALYDRRNLFFRLATGQPYNGDNQSTYVEGRYEAIHTVTLGSAAGSYVHTQSTPSTTWNIPHNLGTQYVHFTVYNTLNQVLIPNVITAVDSNNATITFTTAQAGFCLITVGLPAEYYLFTQGVASTLWNINHALNQQYDNITVYNGSNQVIIPNQITATDANNTSITFGSNQVGFAVISKKGASSSGYIHNQGVVSTTWTVTHNLQSIFVTPTFFDTSNRVIIPDSIVVSDSNTLIATFSVAQAGNAFIGKGAGGTYIVGETVQGFSSGTTAVVVSVAPLIITVHGKSAPKFTVGEILLGLTSFATYAIVTIKESFITSDKSFNSLKESVDALMTEFYRIKWGTTANKGWFEDVGTSLSNMNSASAKGRVSIANNGVSATISDSYGVSSVSRLSTGTVQVNWTTAFSNSNYQVLVTVEGIVAIPNILSKSTTNAVIETRNVTNILVDSNISVVSYGS